MVSFPPCKINLGLHITSKRSDGYHNLETCFYPVPWTDILEIIPSESFSFTRSGIDIAGDKNDNLCVKAFKLLQAEYNLDPVKIHLHKVIPMGAGLGGGSSDGAYTLRILNQLFNLSISQEQLQQYAATLGSDCPFFTFDKSMLATGRGEVLSEVTLDLKDFFIVIIKPPVHVSTTEAYAGVKPSKPLVDIRTIIETEPITQWKNLLKNDFEESVFLKFPQIESIKKMLYKYGAVYASMSGSGSAVFGIFNHPIDTIAFREYDHWSATLK